jgi:putative sporulation protein YtxC
LLEEYYVEVGTANYQENLLQKLGDLRSKEGLPIDFYEIKNGPSYLVRCVYSTLKGKQGQERLTARIYNYYFARTLADIIFQGWESSFIKKILKKEYNMSFKDIEGISSKVRQNLNEGKSYLPETRKYVLVKSILEFLDTHKRFDIEGFMNFRAEQYKRELRKYVARAVNDYALEQEHEGFVRILKKFLESQHCIYKTMHLVIQKQGVIQFFDERGKNINEECLKENRAFLQEAAKEAVSSGQKNHIELYDDFLISVILKCAPRNLIVHTAADYYQDMIEIICEVFGDRISFCQGCSLCQEKN